MTARELGALQESIVDGIKAATGAPDKQLAHAAGVDRTQLSKWRTGDRVMRLDELCGLMRVYGATAVVGPVVALDEAEVVEKDPKDPADPRSVSIHLTLQMASLSSTVHLALEDGAVDKPELEELTAQAEAIVVNLRRLQAGARDAT